MYCSIHRAYWVELTPHKTSSADAPPGPGAGVCEEDPPGTPDDVTSKPIPQRPFYAQGCPNDTALL